VSGLPITILVGAVMVIGVVGTVLPVIPGLWLIWAASLVYGLVEGFGAAGWLAMIVLTVLAGVGTAAGVALPQRSATNIGIPWWGQLFAGLMAVVGFFAIPVVGAAVGFVGAIIALVLVRTREVGTAIPTAWAVVRSLVIASAVQLAAGILMFATWIGWVIAA